MLLYTISISIYPCGVWYRVYLITIEVFPSMIKGIVALTSDRIIWVGNMLPRHIPADLRHFKQLTQGHAVVMWYRTYQSIGRLLPGRTNIILTRQNIDIPGAIIYHDFAGLVDYMDTLPEVRVIWGAQIYTLCLPLIQELHITLVHQQIIWDTYFPPYQDQFRLVQSEWYDWYDFLLYHRT